MKQPQTLVLSAVLAVAVGMVGINGSFDDIFGLNPSPEIATHESQGYLGHIVVKHFDSDGNLIGYIQTDNLINDSGKNCGANLLFGTGFANCTTPLPFNFIALSTASAGLVAADVILPSECDGTPDCGTGLNTRLLGTVAPAAGGVAAAGSSAVVEIQRTFLKTAGASVTINSAGLFDAVTGGNMFAERVFTPSGVTMIANDSIQVTWLITLAG